MVNVIKFISCIVCHLLSVQPVMQRRYSYFIVSWGWWLCMLLALECSNQRFQVSYEFFNEKKFFVVLHFFNFYILFQLSLNRVLQSRQFEKNCLHDESNWQFIHLNFLKCNLTSIFTLFIHSDYRIMVVSTFSERF